MSKIRHLWTIASQGFDDMGPALRRAFNRRSDDDQLRQVYGPRPRAAIMMLSVLALLLGLLPPWLLSGFAFHDYINWPAVMVSIVFAFFIRRYLFRSGHAGEDDFAWLAASAIPAIGLLMLMALVTRVADGELALLPGAPIWAASGSLVVVVADSLGVVAGMTIALAALCYSRNWPRALFKLGWQLFLLKLVMAILFFIMLEIGLMERILSAILDSVFGIRLPDWIGEFADQVTYTIVSLAIYLAIIGATWTVCRRSFTELLATGEIDIVATVRDIVDPDTEKRRAKEQAKAEKKARKLARKQARKDVEG